MTQRERILAIAVGGLILAVSTQWVISRIRGAFTDRRLDLENLQNQSQVQNEQLLAGAQADRWFGEYIARSLPSDPAAAVGDYQSWLLSIAQEVGLDDAVVEPAGVSAVGDVYDRYSFRVAGQTDLAGVTTLMARIADRDVLHRIRQWSISPVRGGGLKTLFIIDAIALRAAPAEVGISPEGSYRLDQPVDRVVAAVQQRNWFEPPNRPPVYAGDQTLVVTRGQGASFDLKFDDPEKQSVAVAAEDLPAGVRLEGNRLRVDADLPSEPASVRVAATDAGYPPRQTEATLALKFVDKPPPPPPKPDEPGFDDASQTVLTALVETGGVPSAWLKVRTRGETLKLGVGDSFEIGSVSGTVSAIDARSVTLRIGERDVTLRPSQKLTESM